jgi:hypothetical protein
MLKHEATFTSIPKKPSTADIFKRVGLSLKQITNGSDDGV